MGGVQLSAHVITGIQHVPYLWETKGNGIIRLNRDSHDLARIARDTGGNIGTEDGFMAVIYQFNDIPIN